MFDFRLQVFHTVAKRLNFTRAAEELFITQPAISKHIHELEIHFKSKLFNRNGSRISLTAAGKTLLQYTEQLFAVYRQLEFSMNAYSKAHGGHLRIGASTTLAQYVLPPVLAAFHQKYKEVNLSLSINNTEQIEQALEQGEIDLGVIEGRSKRTGLKYTEFIKDELVLVCNSKSPLAKKANLSPADLKNMSFLLREPGSGTREVIAYSLKKIGIGIADLHCEMQLASSESMKMYLLNADCAAFLSMHAIQKELQSKIYSILSVKGLQIERWFYFIHPQGQSEGLGNLFMKFANR